MKYLTLKKLRTLQPCQSGLELFEELFGNKMEITADNLKRYVYHSNNYDDIAWLVESLIFFKRPISGRIELRKAFIDHIRRHHNLKHCANIYKHCVNIYDATRVFKYLDFEIQAVGIQELLDYT